MNSENGEAANEEIKKEAKEVNSEELNEVLPLFEQTLKSWEQFQKEDEIFYDLFKGEGRSEFSKKLLENKELAEEAKLLFQQLVKIDPKKVNIETKKEETNSSNSKLYSNSEKYPFLKKTSKNEPYSSQELYIRRSNYLDAHSKTGSVLKDVYIPHHDIFYPKDIKNITVSKLLASGAHLGHSTTLYKPLNQPFVYGKYKGLSIIDLKQTLIHLKTASKIIEGVAEKGGLILFVGSRPGLKRTLEIAASRVNGCFVYKKWVPGSLTNSLVVSKFSTRKEIDVFGKPTGRVLSPEEQRKIMKPDLMIVLNPVENSIPLVEAERLNVPTIGIIDSNADPTVVTYPIPANDDSNRASSLIVGVLSKAGENGYKRYLKSISDIESKFNPELTETSLDPQLEAPAPPQQQASTPA